MRSRSTFLLTNWQSIQASRGSPLVSGLDDGEGPARSSRRLRSKACAWLAGGGAIDVAVETEAGFVERLAQATDVDRMRVWEPISTPARVAANGAGITVIDAPVLATGRLELRWYLREQTVSHVLHRYGNVTEVDAAA
jgi:RHH-type proline utilization regulon transcriptional repressor/proline dehydrogenase/delta 1-pyrroline-5-carboxylate dehydrogenase